MKKISVLFIFLCSALFSFSQEVNLENGLVAYYPFNGNAIDESGNGNDGIVHGAILTANRFGHAQSAYSFDGIDDWIEVMQNELLMPEKAMSISAWFYIKEYTNCAGISNLYDYYAYESGYGLTMGFPDHINHIQFNLKTESSNLWDGSASEHSVPKDQWVNVTGVFDGNATRLYIDGILADEFETSGTIDYDPLNNLFIGKFSDNQDNHYFSGYLDDIRIYNRAINDSEVQRIFDDVLTIQCNRREGINRLTASFNAFVPDEAMDIKTWKWDFQNDGMIDSEDANPTFTFDSPGNYSVRLTVSNGTESTSVLLTDYIKVHNIDEGLLAYYPFNGDANDESGDENHGTVSGASFTVDRNGTESSAAYFDGIDDYVNTPLDINTSGLPEITMCAWVRPEQYGSGQSLNRRQIISHDDGDFDRSLLIENKDWCVFIPRRNWNTGEVVDLEQWQFIAVTFTESEVNFYKNDKKITSGFTPMASTSGKTLHIGNNPGYSEGSLGEHFNGAIDEVRIYNRALTTFELNYLFNQGLKITVPEVKDYLPGDTIRFPYEIINDLDMDNEFIVQLSLDEEFSNPRNIGSIKSNTSGMIEAVIPGIIEPACPYHIRLMATSPYAYSNAFAITVMNPKQDVGTDYALKFDGVDDYADFGYFLTDNDFTVSFWAKPTADQKSGATIIDIQNDFALYQNPDVNLNYILLHLLQFDLIPDKWQHITITQNNGWRQVYLFGQLIQENKWNYYADEDHTLKLGRGVYTDYFWGDYWKGEIDEFCVWDRVMTQDEIQDYMKKGLRGDEADLMGYWKFNSCSGVLIDETDNHHDGNFNGCLRVASSLPNAGKAVAPDVVGNKGLIGINIFGNLFQEGATVRLINSELPEIIPDTTLVESENDIYCSFNFDGALTGKYDVEVQNPDGTVKIFREALTVEEAGEEDIWVEIIGRNFTRFKRPYSVLINYGNSGNLNAMGVPLWIIFEGDSTIDINLVNELSKLDFGAEDTFNYDSVPLYYKPDSLDGRPFNGIVYPLFISNIPPGSSEVLQFKLDEFPENPIKITAYTSRPFFHSPLDGYVSKCTENMLYIAHNIAGLWPPYGCVAGFGEALYESLSQNGIHSLAWVMMKGTLSCFQAFNPAKILSTGAKLVQIAALYDSGEGIGTGVAGMVNDCRKSFSWVKPPSKLLTEIIGSFDPNEIIGPSNEHVKNPNRSENPFTYSIYFENKESASAAAQEVYISDSLQTEAYDFSTFAFEAFNFGDTLIPIEKTYQFSFLQYVDLRPEQNIILEVKGDVDTISGVLKFKYSSLDPETMELTEDPEAGFLPPNVTAPEGQGFVVYSLQPERDLPSGYEMKNRAKIVFDYNAPIWTNEWSNLVDKIEPVSQMNAVSAIQNDTMFTLSWSGVDEHSEIAYYNIYYSEGSQPFQRWKSGTTELEAEFVGMPDSTYSFYCEAIDYAGNIELKSAAEITTSIDISGVKEIESLAHKISIIPNPSNGEFIIRMNTNKTYDYDVTICDITGRKIFEKSANRSSNDLKINLDQARNGIYFVSIQFRQGMITKKVSINR